MAHPNDRSLMAIQYNEAASHLQATNTDKCIEVARYNLTDPNLSRYYQMKNLFLIATAETDWYAREGCRRKVDKIWQTTKDLTKEDETLAHQALDDLREELDSLSENLKESTPANVDETQLQEGQNDEDEFEMEDDHDSVASETERYGDDEASVKAAEKEVFGDDSNIIAMYEQASAQGRARRQAREAQQAREEAAAALQTPPQSSQP